MEWTQQEIFRLIEDYKSKEILWNPKHHFYYNKTKKEMAWKDIASGFNRSVDSIKKKMQSLLSSYRRERCKTKNFEEDGESYSSWFAYDAFRFLHHRARPRVKNVFSFNKVKLEPDRSETPVNPPRRSMPPPFSSRAAPIPKTRYQSIQPSKQGPDEFSTFGEHVANQLRSIPLENAIICENYINNYLSEERLKVIRDCYQREQQALSCRALNCSDGENEDIVDGDL